MSPRNPGASRRRTPTARRPVSRTRPVSARANVARAQAARSRRLARREAIVKRNAEMKQKRAQTTRQRAPKLIVAKNARDFRRKAKKARGEREPRPVRARRPRRPASDRVPRRNAAARFRKVREGVREVMAPYFRKAREKTGERVGQVATEGIESLNSLSETGIHYAFDVGTTAGNEVMTTGGSIAKSAVSEVGATTRVVGDEVIGTAGHVTKEVASTAGHITRGLASEGGALTREFGSGVARIGGHGARTVGRVAGGLIELGIDGVGVAGTAGIRGTRAVARGLFVKLPKATANKVMNYVASKRAVKKVVNPNLRGKWKLIFREEGVPVTSDGFVVHTIKSPPLAIGSQEPRSIHVNVEMGFVDGKLTVRAEPVLDGSGPVENGYIQMLYAQQFKGARNATKSLVRRLGRGEGVKRIVEKYTSPEAFPKKVYAEPEIEIAEAHGGVPENTALIGEELQDVSREAREMGLTDEHIADAMERSREMRTEQPA